MKVTITNVEHNSENIVVATANVHLSISTTGKDVDEISTKLANAVNKLREEVKKLNIGATLAVEIL